MKLTCEHCNKDMGEVRDAKLRNGMVVYCQQCNDLINRMIANGKSDVYQMKKRAFSDEKNDMPEFFKGLFR